MKKTASVVEFKARLSEYLRLVKGGNELLVTERGVPIVRVTPLDEAERKSTRRLRLSRSGQLKAGRGRVPKALQTPPAGEPVGAAVLDALLAERGDSGSR
ncbi:MAG TPA: type II toxin-antitoxin system prevent-host-death family antitoxin [Vicinamibacterales bacterium]|nr:type II toxin-antitoxin system prevent-host-death family antitoxin [Vicinamibacterales bacterium]